MIKTEKKKCTGCGVCANICPRDAIEMMPDEKGFAYSKIITDKCIECGLCQEVCPEGRVLEMKALDNAYLFVNDSFDIRRKSSSGGAFSVLAKAFVQEGGYVFGAEFSSDFSVRHNVYHDENNVQKFQTSKYVQSNTYDSYEKAYQLLKNGKKVLFSGTPCQISALKSYLDLKKSKTDGLLTVDFICHGVGSPNFWKNCLEYYSKNGKKHISDISFRGKLRPGKLQNIYIKFSDGKEYFAPSTNLDLFYYHFLNNYILRESCYECNYSVRERVSDITLADCFKLKDDNMELDDGYGVSFLLTNSQNGMKYLHELDQAGRLKQVNVTDYIQPNMKKSTPKPSSYEKFWETYKEKGFKDSLLISNYANLKTGIKRMVASIAFGLNIDSFIKKVLLFVKS